MKPFQEAFTATAIMVGEQVFHNIRMGRDNPYEGIDVYLIARVLEISYDETGVTDKLNIAVGQYVTMLRRKVVEQVEDRS